MGQAAEGIHGPWQQLGAGSGAPRAGDVSDHASSTHLVAGAVPAVLHQNAVDVKQEQRAAVQRLLALARKHKRRRLQRRA
jgi:hypothetical protein